MEWINVKEKLPPPLTRVLVWISHVVPHEEISYLQDDEWQQSYISSRMPEIRVDYWMPLPESPEGWGECDG